MENDPDQLPDDKAREAAKSLARGLLMPKALFKKKLSSEKPITIADMIGMGALFLLAVNDGYRDEFLKETNREFMNKVLESIHSPEALEEFLFDRIKQKKVTEDEIDKAIADIDEVMGTPGGIRRVLKLALSEALPTAPRGRPSNYDPATGPDRFLLASAEMERACEQFLKLQNLFPGRSMKSILNFIEVEDPKTTALMKKQAGYISRILHDPEFQVVKGEETKTRRLADAIAGRIIFGWAYTYSVQMGGEFRRTKRRAAEE